jgi:predicted RNA-binding Zn-ribbon protein involved in translation (DUF1610 family)
MSPTLELDSPAEESVSAGRKLDTEAVFIDYHCPECGMKEPHHDRDCPWREE